MPLRNSMFGIFKMVQINEGTPEAPSWANYLTSTANTKTDMSADAQSYIQGTAETRILDIGNLDQTISIEAPILVGGAAAIDGRRLLVDRIVAAADKTSTSLPMLSSATVSVTADAGATVSLKLKSDGITGINAAFRVVDPVAAPTELDPTTNPSRTARNYDFQAKFGGFTTFVREMRLEISVETEKTQFLIPFDKTGLSAIDSTYMGTQYPYLGVAGIKITGTGSAAAEIIGTAGEAGANNPQAGGGAAVTIQDENTVVPSAITGNDFVLTIGGTPLLEDIEINKMVINSTDFKVTNKLITVDFGFTCWVKI
jgi:hypothetical protein